VPLVLLVVPERPADIGTRRFGEREDSPESPPPTPVRTAGLAFAVLIRAARQPIFWLLFGTFLICGLTTNGLIGTHMIAFCGDHGIAPVAAAGLLSMMGLFDLIGTTASGWLTDRYDPRRLLSVYYGLRGAALVALPCVDLNATNLTVFAIFYGLDWIATVPPTVKLANQAFGEQEGPIVFGWIQTGHQLGAAAAAFGAGVVRQHAGTYVPAFLAAGVMGVVASGVLLVSLRSPRQAGAPEAAG
jgi:predicted MFS family arabinose efflux permease